MKVNAKEVRLVAENCKKARRRLGREHGEENYDDHINKQTHTTKIQLRELLSTNVLTKTSVSDQKPTATRDHTHSLASSTHTFKNQNLLRARLIRFRL